MWGKTKSFTWYLTLGLTSAELQLSLVRLEGGEKNRLLVRAFLLYYFHMRDFYYYFPRSTGWGDLVSRNQPGCVRSFSVKGKRDDFFYFLSPRWTPGWEGWPDLEGYWERTLKTMTPGSAKEEPLKSAKLWAVIIIQILVHEPTFESAAGDWFFGGTGFEQGVMKTISIPASWKPFFSMKFFWKRRFYNDCIWKALKIGASCGIEPFQRDIRVP